MDDDDTGAGCPDRPGRPAPTATPRAAPDGAGRPTAGRRRRRGRGAQAPARLARRPAPPQAPRRLDRRRLTTATTPRREPRRGARRLRRRARRRAAASRPEMPEPIREGRPSAEAADRALVRKPQIGDTRPAPRRRPPRRRRRRRGRRAGAEARPRVGPAARRRRRRRPPADAHASAKRKRAVGGQTSRRVDAVDADLFEQRRGRERNGRPVGRYLMCVQVREHGPGRRARGAQPDRALRQPPGRRHQPDPRQHLRRPGAERAARHGGRVRRHRHAEERRALPRRRAVRRRGHRGARRRAPASRTSCGPAS